MRSTFRVLFYTKNQAIKNGRVPVMGRITVNGTTASFSCKRDVPLALWDAKGNCAKGKSEEARRLNRELENIKAQIGKHYQYLSDHDSFLTAKKVYDRYNGFGEEIHSYHTGRKWKPNRRITHTAGNCFPSQSAQRFYGSRHCCCN